MMDNTPEESILLGAITFFEKESSNTGMFMLAERLKQHIAINLYGLYTDREVSQDELKECINQVKRMISRFEDYAYSQDKKGINNLLKELGFDEKVITS